MSHPVEPCSERFRPLHRRAHGPRLVGQPAVGGHDANRPGIRVRAQQPQGRPRTDGRGLHEWAAIFLLLFGGFIFLVGWFGGLVLLLSSRAWDTRDKLIGTFIVPGGLATALVATVVVASKETCSSLHGGVQYCIGGASTLHNILGIALFAFCLLGPICIAVYLAHRAR